MTAAPSDWATVVVRLAAERTDEVSGVLWGAAVAGIEERPAGDGTVELRAGVHRADLGDALTALSGEEVRVEAVDDDGLDAWRRFARPWRAGRSTVVVPAWQDPPADVGEGDLVVRLDPGRAFGSGAHPTTRMCLAELERRVRPDVEVADVGCGSGVLAVVAALLGAPLVRAVDIDPEAVRATRENAARNGVGSAVVASADPVDALPPGAHALVVANIGVGPLVELAPGLVATTSPGGTLVLSGLLDAHVAPVADALGGAGAVVDPVAAEGEWRTVVARRPDDGSALRR